MSSWLGSIGSGLGHSLGQVGGSLVSLTGHISNFTKDRFIKGGEEVVELPTSGRGEIELLHLFYKSENERLQNLCTDLEEKHELLQQQMKQQSTSYIDKLQHKEREISYLKERQAELQHQLLKLQSGLSAPRCVAVTYTTSSTLSYGGSQPTPAFNEEDMETIDLNCSDEGINWQPREVSGPDSELSHWINIAERPQAEGPHHSEQNEVGNLQKIIKDLKQNQKEQLDNCQYEIAALQDAYQLKLTEVTRQHRERIEELEQLLEQGGSGAYQEPKLSEMQKAIEMLQREKTECSQKINELEDKLKDTTQRLTCAEHEKEILQREHKQLNVGNGQMVLEYETLRVECERLAYCADQPVEPAAGQETMQSAVEEEVLRLQQALADSESKNKTLNQQVMLMKTQLSNGHNEGDVIINQLKEDLDHEKKQVYQLEKDKANISEELEEARNNLIQNECELRALHVAKQECEDKLQDLVDQLNKAQTNIEDIQKENLHLKRCIQQNEEEHSQMRKQLMTTQDLNNNCNNLLKEKETQVRNLEQQLSEAEKHDENLQKIAFDLRIENEKLILACEQVKQKLEESVALNRQVSLEKDTILETLRREKHQLEADLGGAEKRLLEEANKHKQSLEELSSAHQLDCAALKQEQDRLLELHQQKDLEIAVLRKSIEQTDICHKHTEELLSSSLEKQEHLTQVLSEKETCIENLQEKSSELQAELDRCIETSKKNEILQQTVEEKHRSLGCMKQEKNHLQEELERLREQQSQAVHGAKPGFPVCVSELESEVTQLTIVKKHLEEEIKEHLKIIEDQKRSKRQLLKAMEENKHQYEQVKEVQRRLILEKEEEIKNLQNTIEQIKTQLPEEGQHTPTKNCDIFPEEQVQNVCLENEHVNHELSKAETEELVKGIQERDLEIKLLNEKNLSLTKQIDQLSNNEVGKITQIIQQKDLEIQALHVKISSTSYSQDILQQQLQAYAREKEQILAVFSAQMRENGHLKMENHKMMDIVVAKEAALVKLQDENKQMSFRFENNPQEMFRETLQNLSRIIREKDIEVDALRQKCETLLAILQTSGTGNEAGGVNSDELVKLLQEREYLKQKVSKMLEWKKQVITTVQNMHHESAHALEELLQLQGRMLEKSNNSIQLQGNYDDLIQNYDQHENKLKNLRRDLTQMQRYLEQLCNAKDLFMGKLDSLSPPLHTGSLPPCEAAGRLGANESDRNRETSALLQQQVEELRRSLEQRDISIRALQQDNQHLSDSIAAAAELKKKEHQQHNSELRQLKQTCDVLQNLLKEKELLLKNQSEQLLSSKENLTNKVNENEILRQSETDLKERILILEMEISKLKDENNRRVEEMREKENAYQALQERNTHEVWAAAQREAKLRENVMVLEQKLVSSLNEMETASHQASAQIESLQAKLNIVSKQRDEAAQQLSQAQDQEKQYTVSLGNLQMVREHVQHKEKVMDGAEVEKQEQLVHKWKEKAQDLPVKVIDLQEHLDKANAVLDSTSRLMEQLEHKEREIQDLKNQNELQQEMLEDVQKKWVNLVDGMEGKIDIILVRNLFIRQFHTPKSQRPEVLRLMGSILGLKREEMDQLFKEDQGCVARWVSGCLGGGSQNDPNKPLRPNEQSVPNNSFLELFVNFLQSQSHPSTPPPNLCTSEMKPLHSTGTRASTGVPETFQDSADSRSGRRKDVDAFSATNSEAVPLISPAGLGQGQPGNLLLEPIKDFVPTFTTLPVPPNNSTAVGIQDLSKK
ncbi:thyroid receptor-interacting protein 11-like [Ochotona curzoniae]|uniref:thyroid receptor-interacting protein 11-like n=1 Tax=Ochotona curzoniae TaxID=130825 RepID=UPI001B34656C|nr:thyroid receptor-interacting protein 11-like [Ochotona curzoniae]